MEFVLDLQAMEAPEVLEGGHGGGHGGGGGGGTNLSVALCSNSVVSLLLC